MEKCDNTFEAERIAAALEGAVLVACKDCGSVWKVSRWEEAWLAQWAAGNIDGCLDNGEPTFDVGQVIDNWTLLIRKVNKRKQQESKGHAPNQR